jgi:hypothetical protein
MTRAREDCLGNRRHKAKCTRCSARLVRLGQRGSIFVERVSECGCAVLYCESCAEEPGTCGEGDSGRASAEEWLHGYARMHADRYVADSIVSSVSPSGCGDCICVPPEALADEAAARRQNRLREMREAFLAHPAHEVIYPDGNDVPQEWRREATERAIRLGAARRAATTERMRPASGAENLPCLGCGVAGHRCAPAPGGEA